MAAPPQQLVDETLAELNVVLKTHGGAVEQAGPIEDGVLRLRMGGLCAACMFKPVTTTSTLRPFIRERLGLDVVVEGARISSEAEQRLTTALAPYYESPLAR